MINQAKYWRQKAAELRVAAEKLKNPSVRKSFRRMADTYDSLARRIEEKAAGEGGKPK